MTKLITHSEYMANSSELHHAYHLQFVNVQVMARVRANFKLATLQASESPYFSDVYPLAQWDRLATYPSSVAALVREAGDTPTLATMVCILKAAARHWVENADKVGVRINTHHFETIKAALNYHYSCCFTYQDVMKKLADNEIAIGEPETRPGYSLLINLDGRYYYQVL